MFLSSISLIELNRNDCLGRCSVLFIVKPSACLQQRCIWLYESLPQRPKKFIINLWRAGASALLSRAWRSRSRLCLWSQSYSPEPRDSCGWSDFCERQRIGRLVEWAAGHANPLTGFQTMLHLFAVFFLSMLWSEWVKGGDWRLPVCSLGVCMNYYALSQCWVYTFKAPVEGLK